MRDFTEAEASGFSRDLMFSVVTGYLVILLLRVAITYTKSKHPLRGSVSVCETCCREHYQAPADDRVRQPVENPRSED